MRAHRTVLRGSMAFTHAARSLPVPAVRLSAPVNVAVLLMFRAKFCGVMGSQSPLTAPEIRSVEIYLYSDMSGQLLRDPQVRRAGQPHRRSELDGVRPVGEGGAL